MGPGPDPTLNGALAGTLLFDTSNFSIGAGDLQISQYQLVDVAAPQGVFFTGTGSVTTPGDFHAETPFVTGSPAIKNSIVALGKLTFDAAAVGVTAPGSDLGASLVFKGSSVVANSNFVLRSGSLTLTATGSNPGDGVTVGGTLDVTGTAQSFYDVTRYTGGGDIQITSKSGSITVEKDAVLDVLGARGRRRRRQHFDQHSERTVQPRRQDARKRRCGRQRRDVLPGCQRASGHEPHRVQPRCWRLHGSAELPRPDRQRHHRQHLDGAQFPPLDR